MERERAIALCVKVGAAPSGERIRATPRNHVAILAFAGDAVGAVWVPIAEYLPS